MSRLNRAPYVNGVFRKIDHSPDEYHEWIAASGKWMEQTFGPYRVGINRLGHVRPDMHADARRWICNNPDCAAVAFVLDDAIAALIDGELR